jgi:hypothetical protein
MADADPIFAVIERARGAVAAFDACPGFLAFDAAAAAFEDVLGAQAPTVLGATARLSFLRCFGDPDDWRSDLGRADLIAKLRPTLTRIAATR